MRISDWSSDVCSSDLLHVGPQGLGHLAAAPAIGAGVTALWFSFRPLKHEVGLKMLGAVVVFGLSTIGFGLSTFVPLSFGCLVILGAADMFSVYIRQRSEEHTSELKSLMRNTYDVSCLKKNNNTIVKLNTYNAI